MVFPFSPREKVDGMPAGRGHHAGRGRAARPARSRPTILMERRFTSMIAPGAILRSLSGRAHVTILIPSFISWCDELHPEHCNGAADGQRGVRKNRGEESTAKEEHQGAKAAKKNTRPGGAAAPSPAVAPITNSRSSSCLSLAAWRPGGSIPSDRPFESMLQCSSRISYHADTNYGRRIVALAGSSPELWSLRRARAARGVGVG